MNAAGTLRLSGNLSEAEDMFRRNIEYKQTINNLNKVKQAREASTQ